MGGTGRGMKLKRILALLGVLLLAGLVLLFFILALTGASKNTLMAVAFSILFFSILFFFPLCLSCADSFILKLSHFSIL